MGGVPQPEPAPGRPRRPEGPTASNLAEKLEIVAAGTAISFVPSSVATAARLQPGVATVPVRHIPPTQVCLAWNSARHARLVAGFADAARDVTKG